MNKFFASIFFVPLFVDAVKIQFPDLRNVKLSAVGREKCELIATISGRIQDRIQQMGRTLSRGSESSQLVQLQQRLEETGQSIEKENERIRSQYQSMITDNQMSCEQSFETIVGYLEQLEETPIETLQDSQIA